MFGVERKHYYLFAFISHWSKFTPQGANLGTSRHSAFLGGCHGNHISRQQWQVSEACANNTHPLALSFSLAGHVGEVDTESVY